MRLYINNGDGTFTGWTGKPALMTNLPSNGQAVWGDYDNDGHLDLFVTQFRPAHNRLFRNLGDGNFQEILTGSPVNDSASLSQSAAWADYDGDGFLDLLVANTSSIPNFLYHNDGNSNGWLEAKLVGTASNRSGVGARVRVKATIGGKTFWQMRQITAQPPAQDLIAHFGLGNATAIDTVRIEWPSGRVQELQNVPAKQILTVTEPARLHVLGTSTFRIQSWLGQRFEVQASTDLKQWVPVTTVTNLTGTLDYPDTAALTQRFYRVKSF